MGFFDLRREMVLGTMAKYDAMGWDANELCITTLLSITPRLDKQLP
ncbi:hypothetical protein [Streptosporangium fragile]